MTAAARPARVVVGRAPVYRSPEPGAPLDTHYHYGEEVLVLAATRRHAHCRAAIDGYAGYVAARHVALGAAPAPTHYIANLGAYAYRTADLRGPPVDFLPRHAAVVVADTGARTRGTEYARLDRGWFLPLACLATAPPRSPDLVSAALLYLGCPYLWGGKSFLGLDCSGLVQQAFRDLGIAVPRDSADQAAAIGTPADPGELRRGDLIFIPGHVMIADGEGGVVHADGLTMTVRRDAIADLVAAGRLDLARATVRRPGL